MSKSIEQRIGGPNSMNSLMERGFYADGPLAQNNTRFIVRKGEIIRVEPIGVTFQPNQPNERVVTVFKPVRPRRGT